MLFDDCRKNPLTFFPGFYPLLGLLFLPKVFFLHRKKGKPRPFISVKKCWNFFETLKAADRKWLIYLPFLPMNEPFSQTLKVSWQKPLIKLRGARFLSSTGCLHLSPSFRCWGGDVPGCRSKLSKLQQYNGKSNCLFHAKQQQQKINLLEWQHKKMFCNQRSLKNERNWIRSTAKWDP